MRTGRTVALILAAAVTLGGGGLTALTHRTEMSDNPSVVMQAPRTGPADTVAMLESLEVKGRAAKTGYSRKLFGVSPWPSTGRGCDVRDQILARDLIAGTGENPSCNITTGLVLDPYSGQELPVDQIEIEHVVALGDAWQKGAQQWDEETRHRFGRDPGNLLAVQDRLNAKKRDADAATWEPPNKAYRCDYATAQIELKTTYRLWVTTAEKDALRAMISRCDTEKGH